MLAAGHDAAGISGVVYGCNVCGMYAAVLVPHMSHGDNLHAGPRAAAVTPSITQNEVEATTLPNVVLL